MTTTRAASPTNTSARLRRCSLCLKRKLSREFHPDRALWGDLCLACFAKMVSVECR